MLKIYIEHHSRLVCSLVATVLFAVGLGHQQAVNAQSNAGFQQSRLTTSPSESIDVAIWYPTSAAEA